jgi:hypothetical protein
VSALSLAAGTAPRVTPAWESCYTPLAHAPAFARGREREPQDMADPLHTYLNDHLGGATTGRDLARTLAERRADTPTGAEMARVAREIADDRETLEAIMHRVGARRSPVKRLMGWVMERAARPAMATRSGAPDALGELRAFEMLSIGVEGKCCLWEGLRTLSATVPALRGTDYDDLLARARDQREWLEEQRLAATGRVGAATDA